MENSCKFDGIFDKPKKKNTPYDDLDYFFDTCTSDELVQYMIDTSND